MPRLKMSKSIVVVHSDKLTGHGANCTTKVERTSRTIAAPKRHLSRLSGGRNDQDTIVRNIDNSPGRSTQQKHVSRTSLEHHLFVEFPDATRTARASHGGLVTRRDIPAFSVG